MRGRSLSGFPTFRVLPLVVLLLVDERSRRVVTLDAVRIVQLANFYGPRSGGLRTAVDQLGAGYTAAGHEVILVVPGERATETILPSGVLRITRPAGKIPFTGGYRAVNPRSTAGLLSALRPDVVEVSDRLTLRGMGKWAARRGARSVMISHERLDRLLGQMMPDATARALADVANRRTAETYDAVVCTTAFARREFERIGATNVSQVPLGVDLDMFHPGRRVGDSASPWHRGCGRLLVHCGRLSVEKRVDRSIDSVAALHHSGFDVRLVIAGDGPRRAGLERRARGLPIEFLGFVDGREELAALLASADVAVAPGPHETFGLAALESLATGTPVVVSRSSALADIVTTDCGGRFDDTADGLATELSRVFDLPAPARRTASRARAEQFGWPLSVAGMLSVLESA
ncbi:glycosyltransferase family 1 protein [Rhodococcus sp. 06-156-3C]|nr:glycosyltransferase family 1 protein [Rhodococcus sp. 06-156-4C]OZD12915.1 glycosyltransferase family 1 protein [Rhodococcus sp. 06-156-3C]OZD23352.1 glycosyltransferase family 1 protein [Rhodococcus sp. 06-156-4a]OZD36486.1 glycosyltransferase family 1 protein [Rhodococcus sp. 06-156-3]OZD36711.1 glycosyltransferase family 1 protein [Rhodococcus sp. 06-156-3b]OZF58485.1 glycosyltransferase family 1 protein [Rhodococcus sp. 06-156-4]